MTVSPGARIVPSVPTLAWLPVVKTIASSVPIHSAISASSVEVHLRRAVEQAGAGHAGAVLLQRLGGAVDHALVLGQPEVVVAAEHDARPALHLDHGPRRALHHPEVGHHVGLARGLEDRQPLVGPGLLEDVDLRAWGHARSVPGGPLARFVRAPCRSTVRPARSYRDVGAFIDLPFRLHAGTPWVPPLKLERRLFLSAADAAGHLRVARRLRAVPGRARRAGRGPRLGARRPRLQPPPRRAARVVRVLRVRGRRRGGGRAGGARRGLAARRAG